MSIAKRCFVMAKKAGTDGKITMTGGCAKNAGLKAALEKVLKIKVAELKTDPQLMGALGAAEFARQKGLAQLADQTSDDWKKGKEDMTVQKALELGFGTM